MTGAVAIGALVLEPELLPGIAIGMAAVAVPKLLPGISERIRPAVHSVWRAAQQAVAKGRGEDESPERRYRARHT